jgi:nitrate reductase beta subunit
VYKFVKEWGLALPLHPEFRTLPNLFYVPPLLPTMAFVDEAGTYETTTETFWGAIEKSRLPMSYLASLFSNGNEEVIKTVLKKLMAVRLHRRAETVGDLPENESADAMKDVIMDKEVADAIFRLTSLPLFDQRVIIPPAHREEAMEMLESTADVKGNTGFGFLEKPERGL